MWLRLRRARQLRSAASEARGARALPGRGEHGPKPPIDPRCAGAGPGLDISRVLLILIESIAIGCPSRSVLVVWRNRERHVRHVGIGLRTPAPCIKPLKDSGKVRWRGGCSWSGAAVPRRRPCRDFRWAAGPRLPTRRVWYGLACRRESRRVDSLGQRGVDRGIGPHYRTEIQRDSPEQVARKLLVAEMDRADRDLHVGQRVLRRDRDLGRPAVGRLGDDRGFSRRADGPGALRS